MDENHLRKSQNPIFYNLKSFKVKSQTKSQLKSLSVECNLYSAKRISKYAKIAIKIPVAIGICPLLTPTKKIYYMLISYCHGVVLLGRIKI